MPAPSLPPSESTSASQSQDQPYPVDYAAEFHKYWHALIERIWIVVLCIVLCVAGGAIYLRRASVLYSSTATIQVEQTQQRVFKDGSPSENLQALDFLQTVVQSLKARPMLESVAETNRLASNPRFLTETNDVGDDPVMKALDRAITVKLRRGTRLIDITVNHSDPSLAAQIANSLVEQYDRENASRHVSSSSTANELLKKEAARLADKLKESEQELQDYKETNSKAASLDDKQNTVVAELKELSTKATEAKSIRIRAEADYNQVRELGTNVEALLTLATVANDSTVVASRIALSKAEDDFAVLQQRYKDKHPKYIQARSQIQNLQADLADKTLKSSQKVKAALEAATAAETALNEALRKQETASLELSQLAIKYGVLTRQVESDRALYQSVLNRISETSVTEKMQPTTVRKVQPATVPLKPFSPKKMMIMALSGFGGVSIGLFIVLGLAMLDTSIRTVDQAESMLGMPVLASIPQLRQARKDPLVVDGGDSAGAEGFRTLRAALSMLGRVEKRRVFLFTSAIPQEGKTFSSVNYAASLAQAGLKTLIIDCDLRRPKVATTLNGHDDSTPGVTDYLTGTKTFQEVVHPTKIDKLSYISGGTLAPNPAELLAGTGIGPLIEEALKNYDRVVIDSAPIHAVSDTLLIVKNAQTVCLVVRAAHTSNRFVLRCIQLLQNAEAPLSGVVMNRMRRHRGSGYGYYDYRYQDKKGAYGKN